MLSSERCDTNMAKHTKRSNVKSAFTSASPVYNWPSRVLKEIKCNVHVLNIQGNKSEVRVAIGKS